MMINKRYQAGVYEQCMRDICDCGGWHPVAWSRHSRVDLAAKAARRHRRELLSRRTGGAGFGLHSFSAWFDGIGGRTTLVDCDPWHEDAP